MTNENLQKLKIPAIGLIVVGILNILFGLVCLLRAVTVAYLGVSFQQFASEQEKFIFQIGFYGVLAVGLLSLIFAPIIIMGALKMMRGITTGAAKLSPVLAMIPITSFAFILGIPFGIWALISMKKFKAE